jgi:hypothetical protein
MAEPVGRTAAEAAADDANNQRNHHQQQESPRYGDKHLPTFKDQMRTGTDAGVARWVDKQKALRQQQRDHNDPTHCNDVPLADATPVGASTIENERRDEEERVRAERRVAQKVALQQQQLDMERQQLELERQEQDNPFVSCCCGSNSNTNNNTSGSTKKLTRVQRLAIGISLGVVVVAALVTGIVCGTGHCDGGGGPSPRSTADAAAILSYLNSIVLSNQTLRYDPSNTTTISAEEMAVHWLIHDDLMTTTTDWTRLRQRYALAALYYSATGSRWYTTTSWLDPLVSECDWFGISCGDIGVNDTVVTRVDLDAAREGDCCQGNGLVGTLPTDLFLLTSVRLLDVGANDLTGTIPTEIGFMTSLTKLSLATNKGFTGMLPTELGRLTMLESGYFHDTKLVGNLTATLCLTSAGSELWADCWEVACACCTNCL